ncbi:Hypothetical protein, putative [Bodo saltans]|uniref:Uncharacterized protein n=1 Tax=Bodo saltans TaxID=75058 RepID=A0A0S4J3E7_BODSA|nr:Hypothetical protein, putative [Bodo saltans]|eukprot:CUG77205.1 Hypothetical protein, putative [Bodo saltans]
MESHPRAKHSLHARVCGNTASTETMLKSFIFSKPGYTNSPFTSWGTAINAQRAAEEDNRRAIGGRHDAAADRHHAPQYSSGDARGILPAVAIHRHQHPQHHRGDTAAPEEPVAAFDIGLARRAMTTAWKRRTFVDNVNDIPQMYQHKSVVPAVPISPRTVQTHHRPSSSGWMPRGDHAVGSPQQGPTSGVLPCPNTRPSTAPHPVTTVVAQVGHPYEDNERNHQQQRRQLASRVVHLTTFSRGAAAKIVYPGKGLYGTHLYSSHPAAGEHEGGGHAVGQLGPRQSSAPVLRKVRPSATAPNVVQQSQQTETAERSVLSVNETQQPPPPQQEDPAAEIREVAPSSSSTSIAGSPTASERRSATSSAPLRRRKPQPSPPGLSIGAAEMV